MLSRILVTRTRVPFAQSAPPQTSRSLERYFRQSARFKVPTPRLIHEVSVAREDASNVLNYLCSAARVLLQAVSFRVTQEPIFVQNAPVPRAPPLVPPGPALRRDRQARRRRRRRVAGGLEALPPAASRRHGRGRRAHP